jgi:hypothetical protein
VESPDGPCHNNVSHPDTGCLERRIEWSCTCSRAYEGWLGLLPVAVPGIAWGQGASLREARPVLAPAGLEALLTGRMPATALRHRRDADYGE